jgi:hypothetical protein
LRRHRLMNFTRASPHRRGLLAASARHSRSRCRARVVVRRPVSLARDVSLAAGRGAPAGVVAAGCAAPGISGAVLGEAGAGEAAGAAAGGTTGAPCAPAARGYSSPPTSNPTRAIRRRNRPAPGAASYKCIAFLPLEAAPGQPPRRRRDPCLQRTACQAFIGLPWQGAAQQPRKASGGRPGWRARLPIPCDRGSTRPASRR